MPFGSAGNPALGGSSEAGTVFRNVTLYGCGGILAVILGLWLFLGTGTTTNLSHLTKDRKAALLYWKRHCEDPRIMVEENGIEECHVREHFLEQNIYRLAAEKTLKDSILRVWEDIFGSSGFVLFLSALGGLTLLAAGCWLRAMEFKLSNTLRPIIPQTMSGTHKKGV